MVNANSTGTLVEISNVTITKLSIPYFGYDSPHNMEIYFNNQLVENKAAFPLSDMSGEMRINFPIKVDSFKIVNQKATRGRIVVEYISM